MKKKTLLYIVRYILSTQFYKVKNVVFAMHAQL